MYLPQVSEQHHAVVNELKGELHCRAAVSRRPRFIACKFQGRARHDSATGSGLWCQSLRTGVFFPPKSPTPQGPAVSPAAGAFVIRRRRSKTIASAPAGRPEAIHIDAQKKT